MLNYIHIIALFIYVSIYFSIAGCGGTFSALTATILSPNYPNNYDNNLGCEWLITVAEGHTVELTFNTFNVEGSHFDHVTVSFFQLLCTMGVQLYKNPG